MAWVIIILLIVILVIAWFLLFGLKSFKLNAINLITGPVKSGKSGLCLDLAIKTYRRHLFRYYISLFFNTILSLFGINSYIEKPLFYSNIPVKFPYVELESGLLLRKQRFNFKSVVFIDEISLIVDNFDFKDLDVNESLKLFFKLFGHETHGGKLFINTQNIEDNHYIVKRSINQYLYIHHKTRLPFISIYKVRELSNTENVTNIVTSDIEDDLKTYVLFNSVFKKYDCYCYSILTDFLISLKQKNKSKSLKTSKILSFKKKDSSNSRR